MCPTEPPPVEETLAELSDGQKPLLNSKLVRLSSLSTRELDALKQAWPTIDTERQRQIVQRLVALTEDNLELNFDGIFKHCLKDPDAEVRRQAIEGLWENEEASLIAPLIHLLEQDSSEKVQAAAATALGKFALLAEHRKLRPDHAMRVEKALLAATSARDKPVEVQRRALEAVVPLSRPEVKSAIMAAYESHDSRLKVSSIYAMGKNCDPAWLPILLIELDNTDAEVRYEAAVACGDMGEEAAVPALIGLVSDPDIDVRMVAIQALGKVGGAKAKECLQRCLNNTSEAIHETAQQALDELMTIEDPLSFRF
jgi:HEAT repeat protein